MGKFIFLDEMNYVEIFLRYNTSPFYYAHEIDQKNALHAACENGRVKMLKLFFESEYATSKKKHLKNPFKWREKDRQKLLFLTTGK